MFPVFMGILAVQASGVPCDDACSSSKQTTTPNQNRLNPPLQEGLQLLKHMYKQECLDFTRDILDQKEDYGIEGVMSERALHKLISAGHILLVHTEE
ncbi:hypothetical protein FIBSPDRAFT_771468 [Athelia psychrophila]|uniref:Uncharacterized protein n=1 Tax=Athelia psychrophila TaxID=1759441 RepID=A0A167SHR9_9AGAM|nr:hypothetical protein FIBSPDRAFT_771468 [Fibularhizoctonia sp. CBS 109695]